MTKSYQMNVKKGTRDLTWGQTIAGLTYGDANFSLSATSTNVGGITYGSSDESIVEINGTLKTQHTLEDGLVWYWNFDEDLNGTSNPVNATIGGLNGTKGSGVTERQVSSVMPSSLMARVMQIAWLTLVQIQVILMEYSLSLFG